MSLLEQYHTDVAARLAAGPAPSPMPYVSPYEAAAFEAPPADVTFAYAFVDYGDITWRRIVNSFKLSLHTVYKSCNLANIPFECAKDDFIKAYLQSYSKMRRSVRGNITFLDTDIVANRYCDPYTEDFDVGLTDSTITYPLMPFNAGVMFTKDTPGAQLYIDAVMEYANQQPDAPYWYLNQIAMYTAYLNLKDRVKFKIFPNALYNYTPDADAPTDAYFVHLKGNRKHLVLPYLRRSMERHDNLKAIALEGKLLEALNPEPDPVGLAECKPNIIANLKLGLPAYEKRKNEPGKRVALVGYGPSLVDTWHELKDFDGEIWTVSKAHDFLLARGIVPHTHLDLDFREHKAYFNALPSPTTRYLIATQIHPKYLELLQTRGGRIELFHSDIPGAQPSPGYPPMAAQLDAGLQAAYAAFREGLRDQTWYGFDASARGSDTHAGPHNGVRSIPADILVGDRHFISSSLLIRQALFAERLLCKYPFIKVKITGDGMLRPFLQERGKAKVQ